MTNSSQQCPAMTVFLILSIVIINNIFYKCFIKKQNNLTLLFVENVYLTTQVYKKKKNTFTVCALQIKKK